MTKSDDGGLPSQDSDEQAASEVANRPKKTLRGLGLKLPPPPVLEPAKVRADDEFEAEATQIAAQISSEIDDEIQAAFDLPAPRPSKPSAAQEASEPDPGSFEVEATQIAASAYDFENDRAAGLDDDSLPEPIREPAARVTGLAEDSLPEPIFTTPRDEQPATPEPQAPPDWRANVPKSLLDASVPIPDEDDLPSPIRAPETGAHRGEAGTEDAFPAEKTEILDSPFEQDPSVAKLVALDGPIAGQEFFATGLRNTIGRGLNNTIVVSDLAMSRQHFEIVRNPDESFTVHDLQSINGTTLNGTKVREADLFHGDRLEAGQSTFQFVVSGTAPAASRQRRLIPAATSTLAGVSSRAVPAPAATSTPPNNRMIVGLSVAALVISLLLIAGMAVFALQERTPQAESPAPAASQIYLEGVEALKSRDWDVAQAKFARASELDPSLTGVSDQMRRIELERKAASDLAHARRSAREGQFEAAKAKVTEIPRDSVYFSEASDIVREGRKAQVEDLYTDAQDAMTAGEPERALELATQILDLVPTHLGAQRIQDRIAALEAGEEDEEQVAAASRDTGDKFSFELIGTKRKKSNRPKRQSRRSRSSSTTTKIPNFTHGFVLYRTRKFSEAAAFFAKAADDDGPTGSMARKLAEQIGDFETAYVAGNKAYAAKKWSEADKQLLAAKRADSAISSSAGQFHGELSSKLATVKANLGLDAMKRGDPVKARRHLDRAENFSGDAPDVQRLRSALEKEATSLYVRAANVRKSDPGAAAGLCRKIMEIVPKSNTSHEKAKELLKSL